MNGARTIVLDVEVRLDLVICGARVANLVLDNKAARTCIRTTPGRHCARLYGVRALTRTIGCADDIVVCRAVRQPGVRVARRRDAGRYGRVRPPARHRPFHRVAGGARRCRPA